MPPCPRCGSAGYSCRWLRDSLGRWRIRAECCRCRKFLSFPPCVPPFTDQAGPRPADATEAPAPAEGTWRAWWRPGAKSTWQQLGAAMSEQEAYALLFDFREPSDKIVLEAPRVPWDRRAYAAFRPVQRRNGGRGS